MLTKLKLVLFSFNGFSIVYFFTECLCMYCIEVGFGGCVFRILLANFSLNRKVLS